MILLPRNNFFYHEYQPYNEFFNDLTVLLPSTDFTTN